MDLPPPPPIFRLQQHQLHDLRYGNVLHPPDLAPVPYGTQLPSPQFHHPRPPSPTLPAPAPAHPERYIGRRHLSPPLNYSPPYRSGLGRSGLWEFDPPPKPYFNRRDYLPPPPNPPPMPPRDNIPLRFMHDYPERNLMFKDEIFGRGRYGDDYMRELPGNWGAMELHSRVPDRGGNHERYRDRFYQSLEMRSRRDDDERRRDDGSNHWVQERYIRSDYDGRRWDCDASDRNHALYSEREYNGRRWDCSTSDRSGAVYIERDYDGTRWDCGTSDRSGALCIERDYDGRRWDCNTSDRSRALCSERDYGDRRWDCDTSNRSHALYSERDYDARRWSSGINDCGGGTCNEHDGWRWNNDVVDWSCAPSKERVYAERTWNSDIIDRDHVMFSGRNCEDRAWNYGISDRGYGLYHEGNLNEGRLNYDGSDGAPLKLEDRQPECSEDNLSLGRISGRLERVVSKGEFNRSKKWRPQKKNTSDKTEQGKACSWHSRGYKSHHFSKKSSNPSFRGKEKEGSEQLQTRMDYKGEKQQSPPVDLAISFKSNAFIAKAIMMPPRTDVEPNCNSMDMNDGKGDGISGSPLIKSNEVTVKEDYSTCDLDLLSDPLGVSEKGDMDGDYGKPVVPNLKRKRSSLTTLSSSSHVAGNLVIKSSSHTEQRRRLDNNVDKFVHSRSDSLDTEKRAINPFSRYSRFCPNRVDDTSEHSWKDRLVMCENDFVEGSSEVNVAIEGHGMVDSAKTQGKIPELQEDRYSSESHEPILSSECDSSLLQKPGNVIMSDKSSAEANTKEITQVQVNETQVGVDNVEGFRSLDGTVCADSSNVVHKGSIRDGSFDTKREKSSSDVDDWSHSIGSIKGSGEAISLLMTSSSPLDCSNRIIGKRKAIVARMGRSDSSTKVVTDTFGSIDDKVARCLEKNHVPAVEDDFLDEKNYSKKDPSWNKRPSGIEVSTPGVDFRADGSFHGHRKKRRVASQRLKLSSLSDDDIVSDVFASDCSMLGKESARLVEWEDEQSAGTLSVFGATHKYSPMDVEGKVGSEKFNVSGTDETLVDDNRLEVNDELATVINNLSVCADRNRFCESNSGNELLISGCDMRSCVSSPEELPSYSDLRFSRNSNVSSCQSDNEMICWREDTSNKKPVPGESNTFSLGKSRDKTASDNSPTNTENPATLPVGGGKVVEKLNMLHGKLISSRNQLTSTAPRVFPGFQPIRSGNSTIFNSTHITKSRTWHRSDNSIGAVAEPKVKLVPLPQGRGTNTARTMQGSYIRKGNSLVRKASPSSGTTPGFHLSSSSVYRLTPCIDNSKSTQASNNKIGADASTQLTTELVNMPEMPEELPPKHNCKSLNCTEGSPEVTLLITNVPSNDCPSKSLDSSEETVTSSAVTECKTGSMSNSDCQRALEEENSRKKIMYVKRRSNQLVASSSSDDISKLGVDKSQAPSSSDGYFKSKKYQLVRASSEDPDKKGDGNASSRTLDSRAILPESSSRQRSGFNKGYRSSKFSLVWKLHDTQPSEKHKKVVGPRKVWSQLFPWKKATHRRSVMNALGTKLNGSSFSTVSQKLMLSRKRGAIYKRSTHGYSLRISKVLSVGGASLKWSKSMEKNSKKANEEATRAVAAAEKRKKEENDAAPVASKSRNHVSRKLVLNVKLRPGERIFRIGSERYRMDPTRRTLHRITDGEKESSSVAVQSEKNAKRSYVPRRLLIGNDEYVQIGNGNKLVRDPKKRTRVLANEKVRWSLRTARLRLARKRKYCQFFTRFGKCNKDDGKCPYIHDPSKIVVCTKFLNGACSNADCKLTHKVIPERMQDCSYFLKGSCSNENCPYRHVNVNPDSAVCESFLRGYCAAGNECPKKHTYVCPAYEATGTCPQLSTCKLHHPKKKTEKKSTNEQKIVRGRYFDGGLVPDHSITTTEKLSTKGKDDMIWQEGNFPDYISLEVSDDEMDHSPVPNHDDTQPGTRILEPDELIEPSFIMNRDSSITSPPAPSQLESTDRGDS